MLKNYVILEPIMIIQLFGDYFYSKKKDASYTVKKKYSNGEIETLYERRDGYPFEIIFENIEQMRKALQKEHYQKINNSIQ